jgi:hypothetical protein
MVDEVGFVGLGEGGVDDAMDRGVVGGSLRADGNETMLPRRVLVPLGFRLAEGKDERGIRPDQRAPDGSSVEAAR